MHIIYPYSYKENVLRVCACWMALENERIEILLCLRMHPYTKNNRLDYASHVRKQQTVWHNLKKNKLSGNYTVVLV